MWFIVGLIVGAAILALLMWMRSRNIKVKWYEWLTGTIGLILLFYTVQNFVGSNAELEPTAAWMWLLVTGLPAVILLAIAFQGAIRRSRAS